MSGYIVLDMAGDLTFETILPQLSGDDVKLGDLKKMAKEIKRDHDLAMQLWATQEVHPRMMATLIFDTKLITQEFIDELIVDLDVHGSGDRLKIAEWLLANQLMKTKKTKALLDSWQDAEAPLLRHLFWYHQGRMRWVGQTPPENTVDLLAALESNMASAEPEVQWAMNFTAGHIGIHDAQHRQRCIDLGERLGLYKDEKVAPNCTPNYLPEFIRIEVEKLQA